MCAKEGAKSEGPRHEPLRDDRKREYINELKNPPEILVMHKILVMTQILVMPPHARCMLAERGMLNTITLEGALTGKPHPS